MGIVYLSKPNMLQRTILSMLSLMLFSPVGVAKNSQAKMEIEAIIIEAFTLIEHIISEDERLTAQIREISGNKIKDGPKSAQMASEKIKERRKILAEPNKQLILLSIKLGQYGSSALEPIRKSITPPIKDDRLSFRKYHFLLSTLYDIQGPEAKQAILDQYFNQRERLPLYLLTTPRLQGTPFDLTDVQLDYFRQLIEDDSAKDVRSELHFLSALKNNHPRLRASIVVNHFVVVIKHPEHKTTLIDGRDYSIGGYLWNFDLLGSTAIPDLTKALRNAVDDAYLKNWLLIALGYTTDADVGEAVLQIIQDTDVHPFQRGLAVTAYAKSQGENAIPFLKTLVDDKTEALQGAGHHPKEIVYPIRRAARGALHQFEKRNL